jgi:uncharacterized protein (DUF2252 family)
LTADGLLLTDPMGSDPGERRAQGRELRGTVPRSAHELWKPAADRRDPVEVLAESNATRLPDLVPLRNRRMLSSPFAFFRGSALVMALDLAGLASPGIEVQLCGDAHLSNFGVFASPERRLLFDLNDFDETWPGPFEWDVKRLAASVALAAIGNGLTEEAARATVVACVGAYRQWMRRYSEMTHLDVWYASLDADSLRDLMAKSDRRSVDLTLQRAAHKDHLKALAKLTTVVDGQRRIVPDPPFVTRANQDPEIADQLWDILAGYRDSLAHDRQALFDRYRLVDVARKVVGVGSVGTRCWMVLFQGPNGGPLFLQIKEAGTASPQAAGRPGPTVHNGERVVRGQRMLQSASDVLLGWTTAPRSGVEYYVRQLWDSKGSAVVEAMTPTMLTTYSEACGWALARAHARTADSCTIAGYLGSGAAFDDALSQFATGYTRQVIADHDSWRQAAEGGRIPVCPPSSRVRFVDARTTPGAKSKTWAERGRKRE